MFLHFWWFLRKRTTTTTTTRHGNSWTCPDPDPTAPRDQIPREGNPSLRCLDLRFGPKWGDSRKQFEVYIYIYRYIYLYDHPLGDKEVVGSGEEVMSCRDHLLWPFVIICYSYLLWWSALTIRCDYLLWLAVEIICWDDLLSAAVEIICCDYLVWSAVEIICWD